MTLANMLPMLNIYDLTLAADSKSDLQIYGLLDMTPDKRDEMIDMYGDREVTQITNIARQGVTVWIR
jgi:hypothetical protein